MLAKQANGFTGAEIEALIVEAKNLPALKQCIAAKFCINALMI